MTPPDLDDVLAEYMLRLDRGEPVDRTAFVAEHPQWADALREYFDGCDSLDRFTGGPAGPARPAPDAPAYPRPLGDYELLAEVGRGGMGVVYRARHLKLNRLVALKMVLAPGHAGRAELERFRREVEAIARLDHPNIVPVYEAGAAPDGCPFFAMKWFPGGTLREARGRFAGRFAGAARLVADLARAVHHAHQRGVIHRDLKPSNVFLAADGAPAVGDFGLAKWDAAGGTPCPDLTRPGTAFGTPGYMAPELAAGGAHPTTAVDVYALGAILYELLAGRPPYPADRPVGALVQMMLGDPARPRAVNRNVPRDLEVIALRCLEREPHRRYASAAALADDLDRWGRGEAILARPVGPLGRARKWARRHPAIAALAVAVLLLAAAGAVGVVTQWRRAAAALDAAESARRSEAEQSERTRHALAVARRVQAGHAVTLADHEWRAGRVVRAGELLDSCPEEYRCWEWSYLKRRSRPPARVLVETGASFYAAAFSPDGRRLVATGADRLVRVWDSDGWAPLHTLAGHTDRVVRVATGPGGAAGQAATASADGTVRVWDLHTGRTVAEFRGHEKIVRAVALSPDGATVASGGEDRVVRVWAVADGRERLAVPFPAAVTAVAFVAGRLAVGGADGRLELFDAATGKAVATTSGHRGGVWGLAAAPDGRSLASTSADQTVKLWDVPSGQLRAVLVGHQRDVVGVGFDRSGRLLATAGHDGAARVWNVARGREEAAYRGHHDAVSWVAVHPDGRWLATAGQDGRVMVWDGHERQDSSPLSGNPVDSAALAVAPDGRVAAGGGDGRVRVWSSRAPAGAAPEASLAAHAGAIEGAAFDPAGGRLATVGADGVGRVWDLGRARELFALRGHAGRVRAVAFGRHGAALGRGDRGGTAVDPGARGRGDVRRPGRAPGRVGRRRPRPPRVGRGHRTGALVPEGVLEPRLGSGRQPRRAPGDRDLPRPGRPGVGPGERAAARAGRGRGVRRVLPSGVQPRRAPAGGRVPGSHDQAVRPGHLPRGVRPARPRGRGAGAGIQPRRDRPRRGGGAGRTVALDHRPAVSFPDRRSRPAPAPQPKRPAPPPYEGRRADAVTQEPPARARAAAQKPAGRLRRPEPSGFARSQPRTSRPRAPHCRFSR
ncbi:MAG: protein kinase [Planctomycetes bacterium]|nr:protein kinase [Planctomycetota bacterium]